MSMSKIIQDAVDEICCEKGLTSYSVKNTQGIPSYTLSDGTSFSFTGEMAAPHNIPPGMDIKGMVKDAIQSKLDDQLTKS